MSGTTPSAVDNSVCLPTLAPSKRYQVEEYTVA